MKNGRIKKRVQYPHRFGVLHEYLGAAHLVLVPVHVHCGTDDLERIPGNENSEFKFELASHFSEIVIACSEPSNPCYET